MHNGVPKIVPRISDFLVGDYLGGVCRTLARARTHTHVDTYTEKRRKKERFYIFDGVSVVAAEL